MIESRVPVHFEGGDGEGVAAAVGEAADLGDLDRVESATSPSAHPLLSFPRTVFRRRPLEPCSPDRTVAREKLYNTAKGTGESSWETAIAFYFPCFNHYILN